MPAFVLGNAPDLPVDDLACLRERFTIGVNRILRSGFVPTVLFWVDGSVYREDGESMDASGALMVCDRSVRQRQHHVGLRTWTGDAALHHRPGPETLCCCGNTAACAARWAIGLGCRPVYLVGASCRYVPGDPPKTDFYGTNPHHHFRPGDGGTLHVMRAELSRLRQDHPGRVVEVPDGLTLREVAGQCPPVSQEHVRRRARDALRARGVEVA